MFNAYRRLLRRFLDTVLGESKGESAFERVTDFLKPLLRLVLRLSFVIYSVVRSVGARNKWLDLRLAFSSLDEFVANTHRVSFGKNMLKMHRVEDGLTALTQTAYGPSVASWVRRLALIELMVWSTGAGRQDLREITANHLMAGWGYRAGSPSTELELPSLLEFYSSEDHWVEGNGYRAFLDAATLSAVGMQYASANYGSGMPVEVYGAGAVRNLQLFWLNHILASYDLIELEASKADKVLQLDELNALVPSASAGSIKTGPKVTVLIPVFNGEEFLPTALEGLALQTYQNLEVLIVDDCSTDGTRKLVKQWVAKDSRFKLIEAPKNGGSYRARNLGLDQATGEFVTVHDADDWSHPQKIELQVKHLVANPRLVANISYGIRVDHDRMHFYPVGGRWFQRKNISSLMFRREIIAKEIGHWDAVRFGADSEFHERLEAKFGKSAIAVIDVGPLSFTRMHAASLTNGGYASTQTGITGIRRFYADAYRDWHSQIRSKKASAYLGQESAGRPFAVPALHADRNAKYAKFANVFVADFSVNSANLPQLLDQLAGAKDLALIHVSSAAKPSEILHKKVRSMIDFKNITLLLAGDEATAAEVRVLEPHVLLSLAAKRPLLKADRVVLIGDESAADSAAIAKAAKKEFGGKVSFATDEKLGGSSNVR